MITARTLTAIGVIVGALAGAANASASPTDDRGFLSALAKQGIAYRSPEWAISTARYACTLLDDGANGLNTSREISQTSGIPIENAGYFVGASIAAYCPWHANAF